MQKNYIVLGAILVILLIAFFWTNNYVYQTKQADLSAYTLGSYAYQCTDGAGFLMSPAQDMNTIHLKATAGASPISANILTKVANTNARFEGDGIVFAGNGETVIITAPGYQTSCSPVPSAENAPFNFGDVEQEAANEAWTPERLTLTGEYVCLPHADASGPQTLECALGLKTDAGEYYALDFALAAQTSATLATGDRFTAIGIFTPVETLSSDHWQKYDIKGIFSVTDSIEKL